MVTAGVARPAQAVQAVPVPRCTRGDAVALSLRVGSALSSRATRRLGSSARLGPASAPAEAPAVAVAAVAAVPSARRPRPESIAPSRTAVFLPRRTSRAERARPRPSRAERPNARSAVLWRRERRSATAGRRPREGQGRRAGSVAAVPVKSEVSWLRDAPACAPAARPRRTAPPPTATTRTTRGLAHRAPRWPRTRAGRSRRSRRPRTPRGHHRADLPRPRHAPPHRRSRPAAPAPRRPPIGGLVV